MLEEINQAVEFMCQQVLHANQDTTIAWPEFKARLKEALKSRYSHHWFPDDPDRGCAYRCIHCSPCAVDDSIEKAASTTGVDVEQLLSRAPECFHIWVDPGEVAARMDPGTNPITVSSSRQGSPASPMLNNGMAGALGSPHHQPHLRQHLGHSTQHHHQQSQQRQVSQMLMFPAPHQQQGAQQPGQAPMPPMTTAAATTATSTAPPTASHSQQQHGSGSGSGGLPLFQVPPVASQGARPPAVLTRFAAPYHPQQQQHHHHHHHHQHPAQVQVQH